MGIGFGEAVLLFGGLLALVGALSGLIRGTALSASVLSVVLGIVLAATDVVSVNANDQSIVELIELALAYIPATHLRLYFDRLLANPGSNRTGLPDLVQFWTDEARYQLIEVTAPGDRLQIRAPVGKLVDIKGATGGQDPPDLLQAGVRVGHVLEDLAERHHVVRALSPPPFHGVLIGTQPAVAGQPEVPGDGQFAPIDIDAVGFACERCDPSYELPVAAAEVEEPGGRRGVAPDGSGHPVKAGVVHLGDDAVGREV